MIFVGANTGMFYALNLATGSVVWQQFLGYQTTKTCNAIGLVSTAAVATDPTTNALTVYVAGGDGYLYALDAATGNVVWQSVVGQLPSTMVSDRFNWASPVVMNSHVYMGVSSDCDRPFVPGGLQEFDQATGTLQATFYSVPGQGLGGGVWTSPAVTPSGDIYVDTGSGPPLPAPQGLMYSVIRLDSNLDPLNAWTVPVSARGSDADFASSPVLFTAMVDGDQTDLVAACNKNGVLYAWPTADVSVGPVWSTRVGIGTSNGERSCLGAPVWDGQNLFEASNSTTIGAVQYSGSMRQLDPSTGTAIWQTGLGGSIEGSPSINGAGVLAASTYTVPAGGTNGTYLIDASTGAIDAFLPSPTGAFSQPVFAGNYLLLGSLAGVLNAYVERSTGDTQPPTAPGGVSAVWTSDGSAVDVSWTPGTDDRTIASYRVFRNGMMIGTTSSSTTSYVDSTAPTAGVSAYSVESIDSSGNCSPLSPATVATQPAGTPAFSDGFESGNFSHWTQNVGMTVESSLVDTGNWAARATSTGTWTYAYTSVPLQGTTMYVKLRFYVVSHGTNNVDLLSLKSAAGQVLGVVSMTATNRLLLRDGVTGVNTVSTTKVSTGSWHSLELTLDANDPNSAADVWLDGTEVPGLQLTGTFGSDPAALLQIGDQHNGRQFDVAFDNVIADSSFIS
jgi:outer membrane protein assembly factor BamB